ncbi:hypothetical protein [Acinetobacter kanungonis]|uniref:hypothetical protein n=1 Tax=Acinetobacter kanungonis TaxID=2699469 RepID=UPI00137B7F0C|nr:hypothetical protein [Acinetobacter kanungonis]NCI77024.1 hypothetical protein [Acinetobacter kanungonis]
MKTKAFFGGVLVSPEADDIARKLIQEFAIPKLYNLAFLLQINKCFDDHQTLRLWVQKLSDEQGQLDLEDLYTLARRQLISRLNQNL